MRPALPTPTADGPGRGHRGWPGTAVDGLLLMARGRELLNPASDYDLVLVLNRPCPALR